MSTTFKTAGSLLAGLVALSFAGGVPAFAQDYSFKFQSSDPAGNPTYMVEQEWAKGVVANFARAPKGGDTDQIKSVAAGECGVAVSNTYYLARLIRSDKVDDRRMMERVGIVWPNQANRGTHINISGAGMVKTAKNPEAAVKFLEYLASDEAQRYFADGNNEWPVVPSVATNNPALEAMGKFKADELPIGNLARNVAAAQKLLDRAGYR